MTGLRAGQLADLIDRVREVVGPWEDPPVGRPHVLPLPAVAVAVLFGLRHNMPDEVLAEVFGCSQATITCYHEIATLRWVTHPEVDQRAEQAGRAGVRRRGPRLTVASPRRPGRATTRRQRQHDEFEHHRGPDSEVGQRETAQPTAQRSTGSSPLAASSSVTALRSSTV